MAKKKGSTVPLMLINQSKLTHEELTRLFFYDPSTGLFTRLVSAGNQAVGSVAEYINTKGYNYININKVAYPAHRLAWFYVYGRWPIGQIDHVDGNRSNNQLRNLRECTPAQNQQNRSKNKNNKSKYPGVYYAGWAKKYRAMIRHENVKYHIGLYDTAIDAYFAYLQKKAELHTFNPVPRP